MTAEDAGWLQAARRRYPQLTEKAVVDLVNGLTVVDDHLRSRGVPKPALARIWRGLTGAEGRQQQLIDVNLREGLAATTAWISDLQAFQAESDLAIAAVADRLGALRDSVRDQAMTFHAFEERVSSEFEKVQGALNEVREVTWRLDAEISAGRQLHMLLGRWRDEGDLAGPPLVRVFGIVDQLWWGEFGRFCRLGHDQKRIAETKENARRSIADALAERLASTRHCLVPTIDLLRPALELPEEEGDLIAFLSERGPPNRAPLTLAIASASQGNIDKPLANVFLPRAMTPDAVAGRLLHEAANLGPGATDNA